MTPTPEPQPIERIVLGEGTIKTDKSTVYCATESLLGQLLPLDFRHREWPNARLVVEILPDPPTPPTTP